MALPGIYALGIAPTIDSNVVLYVKLNNNSSIGENSTLAVDSSQYSRNGTIAAAPAFNSSFGILRDGGYSFNGVNQSITFSGTSSSMMNSSNGFATCAFVSFSSIKDFNNMWGKTTDQPGSNSLTDWALAASTTAVSGKVGNGTAATTVTLQSNPVANNLTWYCLDYNVTHVRGFVNGVRTISTAKTFTGEVQALRNFQIASSSNSARWGNLTIDEVIVWNVSKTDAEIAQIWIDYIECTNITENYNATTNTKFCPGTYNFNDSDLNGVIQVGASSITIDGGGATIIGNLTNNSVGIYAAGVTSYIIKNIVIRQYYSGIEANNADDGIANNITGINNTQQVYVRTTSDRWLVNNSVFNDSGTFGIYVSNSDRVNVTNSVFSNTNNIHFGTTTTNVAKGFIATDSTADYLGVYRNNFANARTNYIRPAGNYFEISYNNFTGDTTLDNTSSDELYHVYRHIWCDAGINGNITYNNFTAAQYSVFTTDNCDGVRVMHNDIHDVDIGARIGGRNIYFYNNTVRNVTPHFDGYDLGLKVNEGVNVTVAGNSFTDAVTGIWVIASNNTIIANNTISGIPLTNRSQFNAEDGYDQIAGIRITKTFKSWKTEGNELSPPSNLANLSQFNSSGVTIINNTLSNYPLLLWTEGASNVNHDLSSASYWSVQAAFPTFLYEVHTFLYSINYNESVSYSGSSNKTLRNLFQMGYRGRYYINYSIARDWQYYKNINHSLFVNQPQNVSAQNLTRALIYYGNGSSPCTNIVACSGTVEFAISASAYAYVLNNYSINQTYSRSYDPVAVSVLTSNTKRITSNLTSNLSNVSITLLTYGVTPENPVLTHPSGLTENLSYVYDPAALTITFTASIEPGINTFDIAPNPSSGSSGGGGGGGGSQVTAPGVEPSNNITVVIQNPPSKLDDYVPSATVVKWILGVLGFVVLFFGVIFLVSK